MIPSYLYFLLKKRMELEILKEHFSRTTDRASHASPALNPSGVTVRGNFSKNGSSKIICTKKKK